MKLKDIVKTVFKTICSIISIISLKEFINESLDVIREIKEARTEYYITKYLISRHKED